MDGLHFCWSAAFDAHALDPSFTTRHATVDVLFVDNVTNDGVWVLSHRFDFSLVSLRMLRSLALTLQPHVFRE
ncbi:unnamed protein product [Ixodes pacificus]